MSFVSQTKGCWSNWWSVKLHFWRQTIWRRVMWQLFCHQKTNIIKRWVGCMSQAWRDYLLMSTLMSKLYFVWNCLGFMRGLHAIEVTWHVPLYNKEDKMSDVYRRLDVIAKKINTKHHCSKFDMIDDYSILFYFRAIRYLGVKLYAMLSTTPLTSLIQASEILNQITKFKMLSADDIIAFATQMVCMLSHLRSTNPATIFCSSPVLG